MTTPTPESDYPPAVLLYGELGKALFDQWVRDFMAHFAEPRAQAEADVLVAWDTIAHHLTPHEASHDHTPS